MREVRQEARHVNKVEAELVTPRTVGKVTFLAPGPTLITGTANNRKRQKEKLNVNSLTVELRGEIVVTDQRSRIIHLNIARTGYLSSPPPRSPPTRRRHSPGSCLRSAGGQNSQLQPGAALVVRGKLEMSQQNITLISIKSLS